MKRDFSSASRQKLLDLVDDVEREKFSDITDWIGDAYYTFQTWIGRLNINNYINNVEAYHKKVIDKNNASKEKIKKIFYKVEAVDDLYKKNISSVKSVLQKWDKYIVQMNEIVNSSNESFSAQYIIDSLDNILKQYTLDEVNPILNTYIEFDRATGNYIYNWSKIEELFSKSTVELTEEDYQVLVYILNTMVDNETGCIDTESLQRFINMGYTIPNKITAMDYHQSFEMTFNGNKVRYYYIQNKSYMSDILKEVCLRYKRVCDEEIINVPNNDLNNLMQIIVETYPVVEWRQKVNLLRDVWSGKLYISEDNLNSFNEMCKTNISLEYCDYPEDGSGLNYYIIKSNSYNKGEVRTATDDGSWIRLNSPTTDSYSDCSVRMYIGCKNKNADLKSVLVNFEVILSKDYEDFDWSNIAEQTVKFLTNDIPVVGNLVGIAYDMKSQSEIFGGINSSVEAIESIDLENGTGIKKNIDGGLSAASGILGLCSDYNAIVINNKNIDKTKDELEENNRIFYRLNNLGLRYDTMIVKYDHCRYSEIGLESATGIIVDYEKDCTKTERCYISQRDIFFDPELLRNQYNTIMYQNTEKNYISDTDFAELEVQIKKYIQDGTCEPNSISEKYLKKCRLID